VVGSSAVAAKLGLTLVLRLGASSWCFVLVLQLGPSVLLLGLAVVGRGELPPIPQRRARGHIDGKGILCL
jgi:hypothetical protein